VKTFQNEDVLTLIAWGLPIPDEVFAMSARALVPLDGPDLFWEDFDSAHGSSANRATGGLPIRVHGSKIRRESAERLSPGVCVWTHGRLSTLPLALHAKMVGE